MHVVFDESNAFSEEKSIEEDDGIGLEENLNDLKWKDKARESDKLQSQQKEEDLTEGSQAHNGVTLNLHRDLHFSHAHPKDQILSDPLQRVKTRASLKNICNNMVFLSQIEPKNIKEAKNDES